MVSFISFKITLKAISPHAKVLSRFVLKRLRNKALPNDDIFIYDI